MTEVKPNPPRFRSLRPEAAPPREVAAQDVHNLRRSLPLLPLGVAADRTDFERIFRERPSAALTPSRKEARASRLCIDRKLASTRNIGYDGKMSIRGAVLLLLGLLMASCDPTADFTVTNPCPHEVEIGLLSDQRQWDAVKEGDFRDWMTIDKDSTKTWSVLERPDNIYGLAVRGETAETTEVFRVPDRVATIPERFCETS